MRNIRLVYGSDKKEEAKQEGGVGGQQQQEEHQLHKQLLIQGNDTVFIEADKGRISQVIDNLLSLL
jgi:signal transduction histidine kinase